MKSVVRKLRIDLLSMLLFLELRVESASMSILVFCIIQIVTKYKFHQIPAYFG